jgi:hypothetical protein
MVSTSSGSEPITEQFRGGHFALPPSRFLSPDSVAILVRQRVCVSRASYLPLDAFLRDRLATDIAGPSGPPSNGRGTARPTQAAVRESIAYALPQLLVGRLRAHRRCDRKHRAEPPLRHSLCFSLAPHRGPSDSAELVACECVVEAETKDHLNWELIEVAGRALKGDEAKALKDAYQQVEEQEDEHLYHTTGWCRELWIQSLGLPAVIPPPEEEKEVKTAIGAARAKQAQGNAAGKTLRNGLAMASRPDTATR